MSNRYVRAARRGFSLIEIMIVIAIIGFIAGLVGLAVFARFDEAQDKTAAIQMGTIETALKDFRRRMGRFPTDDEGLSVLWSSENLEDPEEADSWQPSMETPIPVDPWGEEWGYRAESENGNETTFDLWSNGRDKEEGTDDDITNWGDGAGGGEGDGEFDFDFDSGGGG